MKERNLLVNKRGNYEKNNIYYMNVVDIDTKRPKMFRLDRIISINLE